MSPFLLTLNKLSQPLKPRNYIYCRLTVINHQEPGIYRGGLTVSVSQYAYMKVGQLKLNKV